MAEHFSRDEVVAAAVVVHDIGPKKGAACAAPGASIREESGYLSWTLKGPSIWLVTWLLMRML